MISKYNILIISIILLLSFINPSLSLRVKLPWKWPLCRGSCGDVIDSTVPQSSKSIDRTTNTRARDIRPQSQRTGYNFDTPINYSEDERNNLINYAAAILKLDREEVVEYYLQSEAGHLEIRKQRALIESLLEYYISQTKYRSPENTQNIVSLYQYLGTEENLDWRKILVFVKSTEIEAEINYRSIIEKKL